MSAPAGEELLAGLGLDVDRQAESMQRDALAFGQNLEPKAGVVRLEARTCPKLPVHKPVAQGEVLLGAVPDQRRPDPRSAGLLSHSHALDLYHSRETHHGPEDREP